ncbi:MAG TPA: VOC family protein [Thermoplasmata archaeon]|jgi:catechol 2,3-dioxygenase-like lactoylglutathione lyase family enzyme|nr:VOC family protein [Thermoplasmata archaeon]
MPKSSAGIPWVVSVPVVVSDRKRSTEWYTKGLGLSLLDHDDHWVTVGRKGQGAVLHLCQASENQPKPIPLEPGPSGLVIAVPGDFQAECAAMKTRGVGFSQDPKKAPWGWYATVRDPDGNEHHLAPEP